MPNELFVSEKNTVSGREAIFEDDGTSAWLYLTRPNSDEAAADCWLYNRVPAPPLSSVGQYRGGPPPACEGYAGASAMYHGAGVPAVSFLWSKNGDDVAVKIDGVVFGFISSRLSSGYSLHLLKDGPWGRAWNAAIFRALFGRSD